MKNFTKTLLLLLLLNLALFANTVGTITALSGSASIVRDSKSIDATLGAKLQQKDNIKTDDATKMQIIFSDETIISIGKNSDFSIDEYLFDESDAPSAKFGLLSGAMRTITGKIGKVAPEKFSVKTKTATIGIRGTNFSVFAQPDGSAKVFCTFGAISVKSGGDTTGSVVTQGFYVKVSPTGAKSEPVKFTPQELKEAQDESFSGSSEDEDSSQQDSSESEDSSDGEDSSESEDSSEGSTDGDDSSESSTGGDDSSDSSASGADSDTQEGDVGSLEVDAPVESSNTGDLVVETLSETTADSAQNKETQEVEKKLEEEKKPEPTPTPTPDPEPTPPDPTPDPEPTPPDPTPTSYEMGGYGHNAIVDENSAAQVNFNLNNGVFSAASIVEQDSNEYVWTYTISSIPHYFTSINDFHTKIEGVSTTEASIKDITVNEPASSFKATPDDLKSDDSMSWGTWRVNFTYGQSGDTLTMEKTGLWIAGVTTPNPAIDALRASDSYASYNGKYKANIFESETPAPIKGTAQLYVDFGQDLVLLKIFPDNEGKLFFTSIPGFIRNHTGDDLHNHFESYGFPYVNNYFNGRFYGADGKSAGGIFTIMDSEAVKAKGVFQVNTDGFYSGTDPNRPFKMTGVGNHSWGYDGSTPYGDAITLNYTAVGSALYGGHIVDFDNVFWTYHIASTPTIYNSKNDFTYPIESIVYSAGGVENIQLNPLNIEGNYFKATEDILADDSMSWGEWGVDLTYELSGDAATMKKTGLWIAGEATPVYVIEGYRTGGMSATYSGEYKANYFENGTTVTPISGDATLNVDFGNQQVTLGISAVTDKIDATTMTGSIPLGENKFSGGDTYNSFNGRFYGNDGKSAGGNFVLKDGGLPKAKGVYQVKTADIP